MALTKTSTVNVVDYWQNVPFGTVVVGSTGDISDAYRAALDIELSPVGGVAQSGVDIIIETSAGDEYWIPFLELKSKQFTAVADDLDGAVTAGDTSVTFLYNNFVAGDVVLLLDEAITAASESFRLVENTSGNTWTIDRPFKNDHATGVSCYDCDDQWKIQLPDDASKARVVVHNSDADCDIAFSSRISKVTAL